MAFGPFQGLDPFEIVEIAIVLDVIAHAVHKEIRGRTVAADDDLVTIVFALVRGHARYIAHHVGDAHHHLVADLLLR